MAMAKTTTSAIDVAAHLRRMAEIDAEESAEISAVKRRYAFLDSIPESMRAIRKHVVHHMEADLFAAGKRHGLERDRARDRMVGSWHLIRAACDVSRITSVNVNAILGMRRNRDKRSRATPLVANSRAVTVWLARQTSGCSYPILADTMGMDHSTLVHHFQKADLQVMERSGILWDLLSDIFHERA
jgi:hypothetical protein